MTEVFEPVTAVLGIPAVAAALLVALPGYRLTATLNVLATFLTFLAAVSLFFGRPQPGPYLLVDDLNNVFIVLTTFVGFTTSVFSASYIGHELAIGRLTPESPALLSCHVSGADVRDEPRAYQPTISA